MDMVWLIDWVDEPLAKLVIGLAIGAAFGIVAQRSAFCTRSAVIELFSGKIDRQLPLWLAAFAAAIAGMQFLIHAGAIDVSETRFFSSPQSLSGAIVGGGLFGLGMILARGCASRLLVLGASGNLRALFSVVLLAIAVFFTLEGPAAPLRSAIASVWNTSAIGGNDLLESMGATSYLAVAAALTALAAGLVSSVRRQLPVTHIVGGLAIGVLIPAAWYLSWSLSTQVFEPFQPDGLSFIRPFSGSIELLASGGSQDMFSIDVGLVGGAIVGAFATAILFGDFRVQTFNTPGSAPFWRYAAGALLMGFGGVLAAGCTIGAGFTGGSVLAISSLLSLSSMILAAGISHRLIDICSHEATQPTPHPLPAE
uniref:YeeE/YedE family protein with transporter component n=1 Tax=uncultured bacterium ws406H10 TaxID=1131831 RepID=I1X5F2_9BACT|nr:YeeE/YedE family protein with transporter component [uncultured bacterium ws406H10]